MPQQLSDARVRYIKDLMVEEEDLLSSLLINVLRSKSKWTSYGAFLQRLAKIEVDLFHYVESELVKFGYLHLSSLHSERQASHFSRKISTFLAKAFASIKALGSRIVSGNLHDLETEDKAREFFKKKIVSIIASNGRLYRYSLGYYVSLVFHQILSEHRTAVILDKAMINGSNIVSVSCDLDSAESPCSIYAGQYSLLKHKDLLSYRTHAGGGPPYHPWCSAVLEIVK